MVLGSLAASFCNVTVMVMGGHELGLYALGDKVITNATVEFRISDQKVGHPAFVFKEGIGADIGGAEVPGCLRLQRLELDVVALSVEKDEDMGDARERLDEHVSRGISKHGFAAWGRIEKVLQCLRRRHEAGNAVCCPVCNGWGGGGTREWSGLGGGSIGMGRCW